MLINLYLTKSLNTYEHVLHIWLATFICKFLCMKIESCNTFVTVSLLNK